jgi:hypothetical protein
VFGNPKTTAMPRFARGAPLMGSVDEIGDLIFSLFRKGVYILFAAN